MPNTARGAFISVLRKRFAFGREETVLRFSWGTQSIKWFLDASAYTGFHKKLASRIIPLLQPADTLCDMGCGLGMLDLEIAPYLREITAVDVDEAVVGALSQIVRDLGLENVRTRRGDALALNESFDVLLLSFFGRPGVVDLLKFYRRRFIRVVSSNNNSGLYPQPYKNYVKDTVPVVCEILDALKIGYTLESCSFEFGQPLKSWQEAELFVLNNAPQASAGEVSAFLKERLTDTGREDFPFYLPNTKEFGIFVIDKEA